jgi:release factor glutamine methyltransferase
MLDKKSMKKIYEIQKQMQDKFRNSPRKGTIVEYLGEKFVVYPNVFWPHEDSKAIVKNYKINLGDDVLDLCTGSGVIAIFSAIKGAKKVLAIDISPNAVKSAKENVKTHQFDSVIEVRLSDMFSAIKPEEKFDVITMNPPFTPHSVSDYAERTVWDDNLNVQNTFFEQVHNHLKKNGRIYISQAKFGAVEEMKRKAEKAGFKVKLIGENKVDENRVFYAFELKRKTN